VPLDELRLAAVPKRRHHAPAGGPVGHVGADVAADDVQAQVDAGGHAGRGQDVAVVDEEDVGVELHLREPAAEALGVGPVGGGRAAVEQPGRGQHEGAGADGHHPGLRAAQGQRGGDLGAQGGRHVRRVQMDAGHDQGVRSGDGRRVVVGPDLEAGRAAGRAAVGGDDGHLVEALQVGVERAVKDLGGNAQVKGHDLIERQDDDFVHGPILSHRGISATAGSRAIDGR
jgi:hypothetical protein